MKKLLLALTTFSFIFLTACMDKTEPTTEEPTEVVEASSKAVLHTNKGDIFVDLYAEKAPETVKNFVTLAKEGKYDGVPFHRVIDNFMIQTGDFESQNGRGGYSYKGPGTKLVDEFGEGLSHARGALSMANAGPNTGGSQFFIVQAEEGTTYLDGKHAIFGMVTEGMDVVDTIASAETDGNDRPMEEIVIEKVEIITENNE